MRKKVGIYRDKRKTLPWQVRWYGHVDPDTGERRRYCKSFRLRSHAERYARDKAAEFDSGIPRDQDTGDTLGPFLSEWLRSRRHELRPASIDLYKNTIERLKSYFGKDIHLSDITPKKATAFLADQGNQKYQDKPLSDWTRDQIKRHCKTIFKAAVEWRLIGFSPFESVKGKKCSKRRWYWMKVREYHELLSAAPTLRWKVFYAMAYTSGCRMSELVSLTWNDIDFERGLLIIQNRVGTPDMPPFDLKDYEQRQIPLPEHTINLLLEWQGEAPENVPFILLTRERYERVLKRWDGLQKTKKPWRNRYMVNNVNRDFKSHYRRAGIKPVGAFTIHTLRKCCGGNWAERLPMHVVKELMGHSTIATTQEFYLQVDDDHRAKAAESIQEMIEPKTKSDALDARWTPEGVSEQI